MAAGKQLAGAAVVLVAALATLTPSADAARPRPAAPSRGKPTAAYTYRLEVLGVERLGAEVHATCDGASAVIPGTLLRPLSANTDRFYANPRAYHEGFTVTVGAATRLVATGPLAGRVRNVCAINEKPLSDTATGEANTGVFTWRLARPARSLAALVAHPATVAVVNTGE